MRASMQVCIAMCAMVAVVSAFTPYGTCDNFQAESVNEGNCPHRYQDSVGLWTIGIGFNLEQNGAVGIMAKCFNGDTAKAQAAFNALNQGPNSCNYKGVASQIIDNDLSACLLYTVLATSETCVKGILGSQFSTTPKQVISGMIDMAYNMGCGGLTSFHTMIGHIKAGAHADAAAAARSTKWCGQVHGRCDRTTACISNKGGSSATPPVSPPPVNPPPVVNPPPATTTCMTFQSGLCSGPADCMCTLPTASCPSKVSAQSVHTNMTEIIEERKKMLPLGTAATCASIGGTCYTVKHGLCGGSSTCLARADRC